MTSNEMVKYITDRVYMYGYRREETLNNFIEQLIADDLDLQPSDYNLTRVWYPTAEQMGATSKDGKEVYIAKQLLGETYIGVVAHELRHVHQVKFNTISEKYIFNAQDYKTYAEQEAEVDAREYEDMWIGIYIQVMWEVDSLIYPVSYERLVKTDWSDCSFVHHETGEVISKALASKAYRFKYTHKKTFECWVDDYDYKIARAKTTVFMEGFKNDKKKNS